MTKRQPKTGLRLRHLLPLVTHCYEGRRRYGGYVARPAYGRLQRRHAASRPKYATHNPRLTLLARMLKPSPIIADCSDFHKPVTMVLTLAHTAHLIV
jgi:hypothetical protein